MSDDLNLPDLPDLSNLPDLPHAGQLPTPPIIVENPDDNPLDLPGNLAPPPPIIVENPDDNPLDLPGNLAPPRPTPTEPDDGDDGGPLPDQPPGMDWDLGPGTVYPVVLPTAGGGQTIELLREAPRSLALKTNCLGDWITITCTSGTLANVRIFNGWNLVKHQTGVEDGGKVDHYGCFTHWDAGENVGEDLYVVDGYMGGMRLKSD